MHPRLERANNKARLDKEASYRVLIGFKRVGEPTGEVLRDVTLFTRRDCNIC